MVIVPVSEPSLEARLAYRAKGLFCGHWVQTRSRLVQDEQQRLFSHHGPAECKLLPLAPREFFRHYRLTFDFTAMQLILTRADNLV